LDAHREDVWRFLLASVGRQDAEDCFQDTFVSALRAYPRLRTDSNLRAWVLTIAHHKALGSHRARARQARPVDPESIATIAERIDGASQRRSPDRALPRVPARAETLSQAVRGLPERQRYAVALRFVGDLPHRDIAAAIGCSEEAARRSLHEG